MKKIVDFFPYFDPTGKEILELRINMLKDYVDEFIICESNKTQSGIPIEYNLRKRIKELNLPEEKIKIIDLNIPEDSDLIIEEIDIHNCSENYNFESNLNKNNLNSLRSRVRERMQKDSLLLVLDDYDDDTVFIHSDSDEIIKPEVIEWVSSMCRQNQETIIKIPLVHLEGRADLRVYLENENIPKPWAGGMFFATKKQLKISTPSQIRSCVFPKFPVNHLTQDGNIIHDLGWHFSWMGNGEKRIEKSKSFCHYDDTFEFLINNKHNSEESQNRLLENTPEEGKIPPSGIKNTILKKYPIENLPKEIFKLPRVKNFLLPNLTEFDWGSFNNEGNKSHRDFIKSEIEYSINEGISLICACKNRLNALKISLASWLENKNIQEIIIIDWSSDLPIQDNITLDSRIKVIRVEGQTYFNQPQPLNLALKLCTYDTVIKVDCDYIFNTYEGFNFFEKYNIDDYCFVCGDADEPSSPADPCFRYLRGLLYIKKKFLEKVGGWNENFREYYGGEDSEIELRLTNYGLEKKKIKLDYTIIHIPHLSKERIANFEGHNLPESKEKLRTILIDNHLAHNPLSNIPLTEIEWGWETNTKALSELSAGYNIIKNQITTYYIPPLTKWNIIQNSPQLFTAQIVINKLEGFPTIYCASLEESIDRREKLNIQFAEYGLKPKYLLSKRYHECDDTIIGASLFSVVDKIKGCAVSHLKMIKEWYDTTNEEYGFFCEDDLSLETVKYWNFTFQEFINQLPTDWEAVQMCVIRDTFDEIKLRKRQLDDWAVTAYIIKREYAKKIIDYYIIQSKNTTESTPFQQESITYKLEVNGWPQVQPLVEHIILLNTGIVYCFPLFIENINNPTTSSESQAPNHITSANFIKNWWENQYTISSNNVIPKEISLNIDQNFEQSPKKLMEHFYHSIGENWFDYQDLYSQMVNYFPNKAHFIEVGSWKGRSAAYMAVEIINSQKHIKFDCIDTWEGSEEHITPESPVFNPELLEDKNWLYKLFLTNMAPVNHTINPIRTTSLEASKLYPNRSLDFVFIDASHDYENVKADIEAWYPKVKIGGYIGGHDYPFWDGVKKAVDEFLQQDFIKKENITINNISTWLYKK